MVKICNKYGQTSSENMVKQHCQTSHKTTIQNTPTHIIKHRQTTLSNIGLKTHVTIVENMVNNRQTRGQKLSKKHGLLLAGKQLITNRSPSIQT
jgi:hypothetical protein